MRKKSGTIAILILVVLAGAVWLTTHKRPKMVYDSSGYGGMRLAETVAGKSAPAPSPRGRRLG